MTARGLLLIGAAVCGLAASPASARIVCDAYGACYDDGRPTYAPPGAYGYDYGYEPQRRHDWRFWRHWRRHRRRYDDEFDDGY